MPNRYLIEIFYSDGDEGNIAAVPELPGCSAFGETDDALVEVKTAIALWLERPGQRDAQSPNRPAGRLSSLEERLRPAPAISTIPYPHSHLFETVNVTRRSPSSPTGGIAHSIARALAAPSRHIDKASG